MEVTGNMKKLHIKTGDTVVVLSGDDKGVKGEVVAVSPEEGSARIAALSREDVVRVAKQMQIDTVFVLHPTGGEERDDEEN